MLLVHDDTPYETVQEWKREILEHRQAEAAGVFADPEYQAHIISLKVKYQAWLDSERLR